MSAEKARGEKENDLTRVVLRAEICDYIYI